MQKTKVLFVCLGNICRSPLAEADFNNKIEEKGLASTFFVDSCGTRDYHIGEQPDPRTIRNAQKNGIKINHCCRQLTVEDLSSFDYILAMDRSNLRNIISLDANSIFRNKIFLMRDFDPLGKGEEVPDPYFGGEEGFQHVFEILDRTMENFIDHLRKKNS